MMPSEQPEYRAIYWRKWKTQKRPDIIKKCVVCGKEFKHTSNGQKRCGNCRTVICLFCHKSFLPSNSTLNHKYCSWKCKSDSQKGIEPEGLKNNRGKKPRTYHLRKRDKYGGAFDRDWRKAVFERDKYTCRSCGKRGGRLESHHIKSYKAYPELRHILSNGLTLCKKCHSDTDTYGWANYWKNQIAVKRLGQGVLGI